MTIPAELASDLFLARWAKRALTYGASVVAVVSAGLYFLFHTANKAAPSPFGVDPSGFSGPAAEIIGDGLGSLLVLSIVMTLLYWPIGWLTKRIICWIAGLYIGQFGKPAHLENLENWIKSDPAKQRHRAVMLGASEIVPLMALVLFSANATIGS